MKKLLMIVLGLGFLALVMFNVPGLDPAIAAPSANCPGIARPCADGYYTTPNLQRTITGVRTLMSSGDPQIRDQTKDSYSAMRVAVATTDAINFTNCGFGEIGWVKSPTHYNDQHRHIFITYHWEECPPRWRRNNY